MNVILESEHEKNKSAKNEKNGRRKTYEQNQKDIDEWATRQCKNHSLTQNAQECPWRRRLGLECTIV